MGHDISVGFLICVLGWVFFFVFWPKQRIPDEIWHLLYESASL